jgi:hypothetical protein
MLLLLLQVPTLSDAYFSVAKWAYRRYARLMQTSGRKPVGVPGNRDPDSPCPAFEPRPCRLGDWSDCESDGHYLCSECCHKMPAPQVGEVQP